MLPPSSTLTGTLFKHRPKAVPLVLGTFGGEGCNRPSSSSRAVLTILQGFGVHICVFNCAGADVDNILPHVCGALHPWASAAQARAAQP
mmetsp:Transcript_176058/g.559314  ORF Transcript_176058/g.559314 Transcript_176058/m.559314 type:complete len:89 (-) Transcript_176058:146-412(-)